MSVFHLFGRLGADPEERVTASGAKVTSFSLAVKCRGKNGQTVWWRVSCWLSSLDAILAYLKKGSAVMVMAIMTRPPEIYSDKNGQQRISLEVTAVDLSFSPFGKTDSESTSTTAAMGSPVAAASSAALSHNEPAAAAPAEHDSWQKVDISEEIPF